MIAKAGSYVEIHSVVLKEGSRPTNIPKDTQEVPLEMWVKGFMIEDGNIGDCVKIKTVIGREVEGNLVRINPKHHIDYGDCVPELLYITSQLRDILGGEDID